MVELEGIEPRLLNTWKSQPTAMPKSLSQSEHLEACGLQLSSQYTSRKPVTHVLSLLPLFHCKSCLPVTSLLRTHFHQPLAGPEAGR